MSDDTSAGRSRRPSSALSVDAIDVRPLSGCEFAQGNSPTRRHNVQRYGTYTTSLCNPLGGQKEMSSIFADPERSRIRVSLQGDGGGGGGGRLLGLSQSVQLCTSRDMEPK